MNAIVEVLPDPLVFTENAAAKVRQLIEEETGEKAEQAFRSLDPEPLAAASIAQVHRAELPSGERVVLKVQRPGIERTVSQDLSIRYLMVGLAERYVEEVRG